MKYSKHIFICTNERTDGRKSCGEVAGMALVDAFKKELLAQGVRGTEVRAQRAGCIDVCNFGPALVVYPEGVFYGAVTIADIPEIVTSHIIGNNPVERLQLSFNK